MTEELTLAQLGQRLRFLTRKLEVASQTAAVDKAKLINVMARIQAESCTVVAALIGGCLKNCWTSRYPCLKSLTLW